MEGCQAREPWRAAPGTARAPDSFMWQEPAPAVPASAIVAGDFNFTPAQAEYHDVMDDLADAWYGRRQ